MHTKDKDILPGPTKKWRIKRIDKLDDDELDEFYCINIIVIILPCKHWLWIIWSLLCLCCSIFLRRMDVLLLLVFKK